MTSFCPEGSKLRFAAECLRERARGWWEEDVYALRAPTIKAMTWLDFATQFRAEFTLTIELQLLAREFLDMQQTTETLT